MRWTHVNWPAVGYVSLEDDDGYAEHLRRIVSDAPPTVALLAAMPWQDASVSELEFTGDELAFEVITRNDEVIESPGGLFRRWNYARVGLSFTRCLIEIGDGTDAEVTTNSTLDDLDLLAGDVHVARAELEPSQLEEHAAGRWTLRLLATPTGEWSVTFTDTSITAQPCSEHEYNALTERQQHGWRGPIVDGWTTLATPTVQAAAAGDLDALTTALDGVDPNELDPRWGFSPLHTAVWFDRANLIAGLAGRGAAIDAPEESGRSPLTLAIDRDAREALRALIDLGADVNARDGDEENQENPPIIRAAYGGHADIVRQLAEAGADPQVRTAEEATLLIAAAESDDPETVRAALALGVDPAAVDARGLTALEHARTHQSGAAVEALLAAGIEQ